MAGSRIRFTKASQVFETHPELDDTVARPETDMTPEAYLGLLRENEPAFAALAYFAHILPKREAVWWGHQCVAGLVSGFSAQEADIMRLSEIWVRDGDDQSRTEVKRAAEALKADSASVWIGYAAGWSGGSLSPNEEHRVETPDDLTAKAVNTALLIAIGQLDPEQRADTIQNCLNSGLDFARGEAMPVVALAADKTAGNAVAGG